MPLQVIISGAGIGGLALSYWLGRLGASAIVVERAPHFQALGHFLAKPYLPKDLLRAVRQRLAGRAARARTPAA